jgi:hypothetical protein
VVLYGRTVRLTAKNGDFRPGQIPAGFNHSVLLAAAPGGATAGVYAWGAAIQQYHGPTSRRRGSHLCTTPPVYVVSDSLSKVNRGA